MQGWQIVIQDTAWLQLQGERLPLVTQPIPAKHTMSMTYTPGVESQEVKCYVILAL